MYVLIQIHIYSEMMMHINRMYPLLEQLFKLFKEQVRVSLWYPDLVNRRICKLIEKGPKGEFLIDFNTHPKWRQSHFSLE